MSAILIPSFRGFIGSRSLSRVPTLIHRKPNEKQELNRQPQK